MYSPEIKPTQVMRLYKLKVLLASVGIKKPMTVLVSNALDSYIPKMKRVVIKNRKTLSVNSNNHIKFKEV